MRARPSARLAPERSGVCPVARQATGRRRATYQCGRRTRRWVPVDQYHGWSARRRRCRRKMGCRRKICIIEAGTSVWRTLI